MKNINSGIFKVSHHIPTHLTPTLQLLIMEMMKSIFGPSENPYTIKTLLKINGLPHLIKLMKMHSHHFGEKSCKCQLGIKKIKWKSSIDIGHIDLVSKQSKWNMPANTE
jgi:hypothetical protein